MSKLMLAIAAALLAATLVHPAYADVNIDSWDQPASASAPDPAAVKVHTATTKEVKRTVRGGRGMATRTVRTTRVVREVRPVSGLSTAELSARFRAQRRYTDKAVRNAMASVNGRMRGICSDMRNIDKRGRDTAKALRDTRKELFDSNKGRIPQLEASMEKLTGNGGEIPAIKDRLDKTEQTANDAKSKADTLWNDTRIFGRRLKIIGNPFQRWEFWFSVFALIFAIAAFIHSRRTVVVRRGP